MSEQKPPVAGYVMLAVFLTGLIATNVAVFFLLRPNYSVAMATCLFLDWFFLMIIRPVRP